MGCFPRLSSGTSYVYEPRNPDPSNFRIVRVEKCGDLYVSKINYPNCTNYEGNKILLTTFNPKGRSRIDPHFSTGYGLIARFEPTTKGWNLAVSVATMLGMR